MYIVSICIQTHRQNIESSGRGFGKYINGFWQPKKQKRKNTEVFRIMAFKKAIKKIAALGAGLGMAGATLMGAMAFDLGEFPSR
jgi:3'-phosphoadenosine 5'-phosphosulfate sulfotransferase (PAPS reductase)/FAD synthetase